MTGEDADLTCRVLCVAVALAVLPALAAPEEPETGSALVRLGDGSQVLLRSWSLSYEYSAWRRGEGPAQAKTSRRPSRDLWSGKRVAPTTGFTLDIQYDQRRTPAEEPRARVLGLVLLAADGKKTTLKPEPPHADLLLPGAEGMIVSARSLDLLGETLAGTRREFCLLSYSPFVECGAEPAQQVVKVQFQP